MSWTRARILRTILGFAMGSTLGMMLGIAVAVHVTDPDGGILPAWGGSAIVGSALSGYFAGGATGLTIAQAIERRRRDRRVGSDAFISDEHH